MKIRKGVEQANDIRYVDNFESKQIEYQNSSCIKNNIYLDIKGILIQYMKFILVVD